MSIYVNIKCVIIHINVFPLSWFRLKFLRVLFISLYVHWHISKDPVPPLTRHRCWPVDFKWCASCAAVNASNLNCLAASSCVPQGGTGGSWSYGYWCCCALVEPCGTKINQVGQVSSFSLCSLYLKLTCVRLNRTLVPSNPVVPVVCQSSVSPCLDTPIISNWLYHVLYLIATLSFFPYHLLRRPVIPLYPKYSRWTWFPFPFSHLFPSFPHILMIETLYEMPIMWQTQLVQPIYETIPEWIQMLLVVVDGSCCFFNVYRII